MDRSFYTQDSATVAAELLGCTLVHGDCSGRTESVDRGGNNHLATEKLVGRIVETEAYYGDHDVKDPASHAFAGETERNQVMFGPAGRSYVYICYGIHHMLNVTTGEEGVPGAVLIRAVAPREGIDTMRGRRGVDDKAELCSGPGKLCEAFGITKDHNDIDLTTGHLRIEHGDTPSNVVRTTRIGISEGQELELRFYDADSRHVSQL